MKTRLMMISSALMASLLCLPALAQPGPGMGGMAERNGMGQGMGQNAGPGTRALRDCSQAPNPGACTAHREARAKAMEACRGQMGPERRQCKQEQRRNFDCAKSANPQRCEARKLAYSACKDQPRPAFRQCMQEKMPPLDCSKAPNPQRCDLHQKARDACKDKLGPEHKACLREQFNVK